MKKVYYTNARYSAIVKFQHESGEIIWARQGNLDINEAKKLHISINKNKGDKAHLVGNLVFWGHLPGAKNGTIEGVLLEEVKPFYFE